MLRYVHLFWMDAQVPNELNISSFVPRETFDFDERGVASQCTGRGDRVVEKLSLSMAFLQQQRGVRACGMHTGLHTCTQDDATLVGTAFHFGCLIDF